MTPVHASLLAAAIPLGTAHPAASQGVLAQRNQAIQLLALQVDSSTLQRLATIQTSYDRRIAAAFDRNPALRDKMKAALEPSLLKAIQPASVNSSPVTSRSTVPNTSRFSRPAASICRQWRAR